MSDDIYDACAWGSHLPALLACLADTVGPVLEVGIGHFSTPALHAYCNQCERTLVSVEDNPDWFKVFEKLMDRNHTIIVGDYNVWLPALAEKSWSVTFIDNSPGGKRRSDDFCLLSPRSVYTIVHDYHKENSEAIEPFLGGFNYHVTQTYQPPTLVASRTRPIPQSILLL